MNIALINSIGKSKWGGGEKWMIMAAIGLKSLGHNVVVICRKNSILASRAGAKNILVKEIGANSDFDLVAGFKFGRFFKDFQPDAVIGCQNKDWRVAAMSLKMIGSSAKVYSRQGLQLLKNSWWYKWSIKMFSDGIITNTHSIKDYYDSFLPVEPGFVKVVFNGVEEISGESKAFDFSQYLPDHEKDPVIVLSTGRLARQKGFKYLISAAAEIVKTYPNVYFFLAGHGKLESELRTQIKKLGIEKNFILLGFFDDINPLLIGADIFVFSSLFEGMPNSILEAMAHGLPVVSTNVNGVAELIEDGKNGFLVSPGTTEELTQALEYVVKNKNKMLEIGNNARQFVSQNFSVSQMVNKLNGLITKRENR
jgi:glycosyltransferase involved in cell wall biosynthesis